jgi:hypothetical protein
MNFRYHICLFFIVGLLAGCVGVPLVVDQQATPEKVATDIGLPSDQLGTLVRCTTADTTPGTKGAVYRPCLYAALPDGAALIVHDFAKDKYVVLHQLDARTVRAVAMAKMGRARQIQIHSERGFTVLDMLSDDRVWGNRSALDAAYDHLRSVGIAVTEPARLVILSVGRSIIF